MSPSKFANTEERDIRKRKGACTACNKRIGTVSMMKCKYCDLHFCMSCRLPEVHQCTNMSTMRLEKTTTLATRLEAERCISSKIVRI